MRLDLISSSTSIAAAAVFHPSHLAQYYSTLIAQDAQALAYLSAATLQKSAEPKSPAQTREDWAWFSNPLEDDYLFNLVDHSRLLLKSTKAGGTGGGVGGKLSKKLTRGSTFASYPSSISTATTVQQGRAGFGASGGEGEELKIVPPPVVLEARSLLPSFVDCILNGLEERPLRV